MERVENTTGNVCPTFPPGSSVTTEGVTPRWRGARPVTWSRQRSQEVRAVHAFKRERSKRELDRAHAMSGTRLLAYRRTGKARPFGRVLVHAREVRRHNAPTTERAAELGHADESGWRLSTRDLLALAWLAAVAIGFKTDGLAIRLADWAELLECSPRTAGSTMRRLAAMGLVSAEGYFVAVPGGMARRESTYRLAPEVLSFFRALDAPGEPCQAEETESSLRSDKKVSPVGDDVGRAPEEVRAGEARGVPAASVRNALGALAHRLEQQVLRKFASQDTALAMLRARVAAAPRAARPPDPEPSPLVVGVAQALGCDRLEASRHIELARDHRASCTCAVCWTRGRV
jgi:hypothetical protein